MGRQARYTGNGGSEGDHRLHQPGQGVLCSRAGHTGNRGWEGELHIQVVEGENTS